jgi:hypothetical protein
MGVQVSLYAKRQHQTLPPAGLTTRTILDLLGMFFFSALLL